MSSFERHALIGLHLFRNVHQHYQNSVGTVEKLHNIHALRPSLLLRSLSISHQAKSPTCLHRLDKSTRYPLSFTKPHLLPAHCPPPRSKPTVPPKAPTHGTTPIANPQCSPSVPSTATQRSSSPSSSPSLCPSSQPQSRHSTRTKRQQQFDPRR